MSSGLLNYVSLAQVAATATSFRLHAGVAPPTTYSGGCCHHDRVEAFFRGIIFYICARHGNAFGACILWNFNRGGLFAVVFYLQRHRQRVVGSRPVAGAGSDRGYRK